MGDIPTPADIDTSGLVLHKTFGRAEREAAAWLIVRLLQVRGQGWDAPFGMRDFAWLVENDEATRARCGNPFWRPDFWWLVDNHFVWQTNLDSAQDPCFVTANFIAKVTHREVSDAR